MALDLETIYGLVARKELSVEGAKVLLSSPRAATDTAAPAGTGVGPRAADSGPIAVIGMSGRFPGADDLEAFWENLALGRSAITEVPRERWDVSTYYDPDPTVPDRTRCKWGGFLRDVDRFDPLFFNISGKEAELADPQQRLFLEEAWKALEDAGYSDTALEGRRCGVFVGTGSGDYTYTMKDHGVPADPYAFMGNAVSILAARISYVLNLKGPSIAVDTACSSSLVALHLACQSILMGESELALAGGVFVSTHPSFHYLTGRAGMLSPEGRCKAFDDGADGFVPGEGVGVVVLKPLARALADGDHVYGVIRASGVNQDGRTNGITAPSAVSQAELEQEVYRRAGISPETISYVEAHGTGTRLGDPIEVHALTKAFRASTDRKQFCALGSVKTNIGHASTAAGIAGVIKVLLSLKYRQLAPSLNFDTPNTHIPFAETPFFVNTALRAWMPEPGVPRRAAVSSFGLSGTNAHVLIEEAPGAEPRRAQEARRFHLAVVSAKTEEALAARLRDLERWLERYPGECDVRDLCATLALGRAQFPVRAAFVVSTAADLRAQLQAQRESGEEQARKTNLGRKRPVGPGRDPVLRERARALLEELRASPEAGEPAWARLAEVYLAPQDIDWSELYPTGTWRRVPLPTYPFARERYWAFAAEEPSYFVPEWQPTPGDMGGAESPPSLLIVLDDTGARLEALRRAAAERWAQVPRIVWVKPGRTFAALEDGFELDPARAEDWKRLGTALGGPGARMGVLHFGGLADPYQAEPLARVRSMLVLVRALAGGSEARLLYFHRSTPEAPLPGDAAVAGLLRAVPALEPRLRLSTIGLSAGEVDRVATIAVEELSAPESAELCHVEGRRLRRTYVPVSLPTSMPLPVVKQGAVVLITGGAGALGVAIGRHLAATSGAKLVLTGSAPEPTHQEAIQSLRAGGAEVLYVSADVRDETAMAAVVAEAKRRFGRLDGVIHAAGRLGGVLLNQKDDAALERVLAPKVLGACVLDTVTGDEPLDFFVLYSSIASVLGDFGQCDYAVANRFLDEFAAQRERRRSAGERSGTTVSINWPLWQATGMVTPSDATELYLRNAGLRLLTVEKGARAFERALTLERAQVLVLDGETEKLPRLLAAAPARVSAPAEPSPPPLSPQAEVHMQRTSEVMPAMDDIHALEQATLREVTAILAGLLKLPTHRLPPDAHLSEFGIDSILIKDLTERINQRFGVSLTPALFFSLSTLAGISKHLVTGPGAVAVSRAPAVSPAPTPPAPLPPPVPAPPVAPAPAPRSARPRVRAEGPEPVAIIGASGVFPQSADLETFWRNLEAERDLVTEVPPERWDWRRHYNTTEAGVSRTNSKWGGFMPDVDKFDAAFFNISPREAAFLDPQARLFLETTWKTIEDAGYRASALAGRPVGLFVGAQLQEYIGLMGNLSSLGEAQAQAVLGNTHTMIANRVSYLLDLRGPSEAIDTACSSALVALYRAVRSIQSGECELAIAGGVSAMLSAETFALASQLGMLSPEGRCKTFDKSANGYVKGEGVGAVLLKPLSRAVADGDHVYAVVRGVAINHGGKANSLTAPNPAAQAELLIQAYSEAGIDPKTVTYVETHGTGTELGDPVEVDGLKRAFKALTGGEGGNAWCGLGAVKSNIGHLEPAAGIASLVKVMLALRHKRLPATLHVRDLNPYLQLDGSPFYLVTRTQEWKALTDGDGRPSPRRAGISSFGFGGSNAHAVLEEYVEDVPPPSREEESPQLLVLSARDEERLKHAAERLLQHLEHQRELSLADVAFTLQCGREPMGARLALVARTRAEAMSRLGAWLQGREAEGVSSGRARGSEARSALLDRSEELTEFVRALVQRGKLAKLGALWVEGGEVDWSLLHAGARRKRLPLPTYPFARVRHWFDTRRPVEAPRPAAPAPSVEPVVPKFEPVVPKSEPAFAAPVPAPRQLAPVVPSRSGESLKRELTELLAAALYLRPSEIDEGTSFAELGVDSILAVELVKQMNQRFGLELKATRLYDYPCIRDLAGYLATVVGDMAAAPIPVAEAPEVQAPPPRAEPAVRLVEVTSRGPGEGGPATLERVSSLVAGVLGVPVSQVDVRASLLQLGLEMAQAAELARRLRSQLGVELQPIRLYDFANVEELASHVGYRQQPVPAPVVESRPAAPVQSLPPAPAVSAAPMARRSVESIQRELTEMFAAALYLRPEEIGEGTSFAELGVDSILAVELVKQMNQRFGLELKATRLYDYPCIRDLAGYLATVGVSAAPKSRRPCRPSSLLPLLPYRAVRGRAVHLAPWWPW